MSEDKLLNETARGYRADALLENELLKEAFDSFELKCTATWRNARDPAVREAAWNLLAAADEIKGYLKHIRDTGKIAEVQIQNLSKMKKRHS